MLESMLNYCKSEYSIESNPNVMVDHDPKQLTSTNTPIAVDDPTMNVQSNTESQTKKNRCQIRRHCFLRVDMIGHYSILNENKIECFLFNRRCSCSSSRRSLLVFTREIHRCTYAQGQQRTFIRIVCTGQNDSIA